MTIDRYLAELRALLRGDPLFRRRVLAEVESHLRESAERHGEAGAIERFGPPEAVASGFARSAEERAALAPAVAVLLSLGAFLVAYGAIENALPPAPWPSTDAAPAAFRWPTLGAEIALVAAGVSALGALFLRRIRLVTGAIACAAVTLAAMLAIAGTWALYVEYERLDVVGRPGAPGLVLGSLWLAAAVVAAVGSLVWATAQRASRSNGLSR